MLLLSIHPKYVEAILSGAKLVELRRKKPRINSGPALIYATSPQMELVAQFQIASIFRAPLGLLWQSVREEAAVSRREFDIYFAGLDSGVAIRISSVRKFRQPIPLDDLRRAWHGFHPPQGFHYLSQSAITAIFQADGGRTAGRAA